MRFKPLPLSVRHKLLEGCSDILTPLAQQRAATLEETPCPRCGGGVRQQLHPMYAFTPDEPLPRAVGVCEVCGYTYDPAKGLVLNVGDPSKVRDPLPIIRPED